MMTGEAWIPMTRSGPDPEFSKRCGMQGGPVTVSPAVPRIDAPPTVKVASPSSTIQVSA